MEYNRPIGKFDLNQCGRSYQNLEDIEVLGWFGRDVEGEYKDDESVLKYLHIPPSPDVNFDLTLRHEKDEERTSGLSNSHMFKWISEHSKDRQGNPKKPDVNIVIYRNYLQILLQSPYEKDGWDLFAIKIKGTIYIYLIRESIITAKNEALLKIFAEKSSKLEPSETDRNNKEETKEEEITIALDEKDIDTINQALKDVTSFKNCDMFGRYGGKFEQYLTSGTCSEPPDPTQPLRKYDDFCCMMRARLGHLSILYTGEVDAMPLNQDLNNLTSAEFVEIKSVKEGCNPYSHKRYRLLKTWAQCVLANCKWVLWGHRDDSVGVVKRLERTRVEDIPYSVDKLWNPNKCFDFTYNVLSYIEKILDDKPENIVFCFKYRPTKYGNNAVFAFKSPGSDIYVPEFYKTWVNSLPEEEEKPQEKKKELYIPPWRRNNKT